MWLSFRMRGSSGRRPPSITRRTGVRRGLRSGEQDSKANDVKAIVSLSHMNQKSGFILRSIAATATVTTHPLGRRPREVTRRANDRYGFCPRGSKFAHD